MGKHAPLAALVLGMMVLAAACGGGGGTIGKIQTSDGEYSITRAEWEKGKGFVVSLRRDSEREGQSFDFCPTEGGQVYITASDGSKAPCAAWSMSMTIGEAGPMEFDLIFTPPASAQGFTLFVPDNPPIDLGK